MFLERWHTQDSDRHESWSSVSRSYSYKTQFESVFMEICSSVRQKSIFLMSVSYTPASHFMMSVMIIICPSFPSSVCLSICLSTLMLDVLRFFFLCMFDVIHSADVFLLFPCRPFVRWSSSFRHVTFSERSRFLTETSRRRRDKASEEVGFEWKSHCYSSQPVRRGTAASHRWSESVWCLRPFWEDRWSNAAASEEKNQKLQSYVTSNRR